MLAKAEGEVLDPEHVEILPEDQNTTAADGQSTKPTAPVPVDLGVPESAKPTPPNETTLDALESARPTPLPAKPTPTVPVASKVSSDNFASTVAAMVGMEVPKVSDEEMVDNEATPERGEVNVVVLSADYYIVEDDSAATVFNFLIQDATFKKLEHPVNHLKPLHVKGHINGTWSITCWWTMGQL
jgi:hypothetical protein